MKKLSEYSEKELIQWYESTILADIKKDFPNGFPVPSGKQSKLNHDLWSVYAYGDTIKVVYIKSAPIRKKKKIENCGQNVDNTQNTKEDKKRFSQSVSRAKNRIFELAMCNEFRFFCTFTQDQKMRNRFNLAEFRKDLSMLIRNLNRGRENKIKYLLIPEQHEDGAWHMHGLMLGLREEDLRLFTLEEKLPYKIREKLQKGEKIYDFTPYRRKFGFFTCTPIKDKNACSKYITKYISKDLQKTVLESGAHLFFASQGLKSREVVLHNCLEKCPFTEWDYENDYVKIKEFSVQNLGQ